MPCASCIVIFHPMDPRGAKLGGIETHVRLLLANHPAGVEVMLVGVDEIGDLDLGRVTPLAFRGRDLRFLPVLRADAATINAAAMRIGRSLTLRYVLAALRRIPAIRGAIGQAAASCEIGRFEFAALPLAVGRRCVLTVHNEGRRGDAMDSLLKRWWWLHRLNERIALARADAVVAVNDGIAAHVAALSRRAAARTRVLSVAVDTGIFRPSPFEAKDDILQICFAGRLDAFKRPALMFEVVALAAERVAARPIGRFRRVGFLYAGASDPGRVEGYERLHGIVQSFGILDAPGVAALMQRSHLGIITSVFEGLPCYLLEMLASGRPVVACPLPQFVPLIEDGISGRLCPAERDGPSAAALADALITVAREIADGTLEPATIATKVTSRSVEAQMGQSFALHEALARQRGEGGAAPR